MSTLLLLAALARADDSGTGTAADPAPTSEPAPPTTAEPAPLPTAPPKRPPRRPPAMAVDNPTIRTGLIMSDVGQYGALGGLGMVLAGGLITSSAGCQDCGNTAFIGQTVQLSGFTVLGASAVAVTTGPVVTSVGIRQAGVKEVIWPGWTGVSIVGASALMPIADQLGAFDGIGVSSGVVYVASVAGLVGGSVMIQAQDGINRRTLHLRPGLGGFRLFGEF